jgi:hypothetical protein
MRRAPSILGAVLLVLASCLPVSAQVKVSANVPGIRYGSGAPVIGCAVGDIYRRTDGAVGTTLYTCTAANTWTGLDASPTGYFSRVGTVLSPATAGDAISVRTMTPGGTEGLYAGTDTLVRIFQAAAGAGGQSTGQNVFVGGAGNSTMTNGAGAVTLASRNVAMGWTSFLANTTGFYNVALGDRSMVANTTGNNNVAVGSNTLAANTDGISNTALGTGTLALNVSGSRSTAVGDSALFNNLASDNTAVGDSAAENTTTGVKNTALGHAALQVNATGGENTAVGDSALFTTSVGQLTAVGKDALKLNTTGLRNTAVGYSALNANTTGADNTAVGFAALAGQATSSTAVGTQALGSNTTGTANVAVGETALYSNTDGAGHTAVGRQSLFSQTGGYYNTAAGNLAGFSSVTGSNNVFLGFSAGRYETGSNAIYLDNLNRATTAGDKAGAPFYAVTNATPANQTIVLNAGTTTTPGTVASAGYLVGATPGIDKTCGGPVISSTHVKGILTAMTCTSEPQPSPAELLALIYQLQTQVAELQAQIAGRRQ